MFQLMPKTFTLFPALLFNAFCGILYGQQEHTFSQFMYNKMAYNPGYAGTAQSPVLNLHDRHQWIGFDGALNAQRIAYSQPIMSRRGGLGGALSRVEIGITRTVTFELSYSYRIAFRRGYLGLGLQGAIRQFSQNWTDDRLRAPQLDQDGAVPTGNLNKFFPNFAAGAFYNGYRFYAGVAIQRLLPANIDFSEIGDGESKEVPHLNAMTGIDFMPNEDVKITPQLLLRYVPGAPFDADINVTTAFKERFYTGLTYRTGGDGPGESIIPMAGMQATPKLFFQLSYDATLSRLRSQQAGTIEVSVRWWFAPPAPDKSNDTAPPVY